MCFLHIMKTISEGKESSLKLDFKKKGKNIEFQRVSCYLVFPFRDSDCLLAKSPQSRGV